MMRAIGIATASVSLLVAVASGQSLAELRLKERVEVPGHTASVMIAPFVCDGDGNVLFQPYAGRSASGEVLRLSRDGKKATHFSVGSVPGFEHSSVGAFGVSADNDVYLASFKLSGDKLSGDNYILRFDKDGQYRAATKLDLERGGVTQLAVFSPASFFVAGSKLVSEAAPTVPFAAIFNDSGKMVASVHFPHDPDRKGKEKPEWAADLIGPSLAQTGDDGNVYFTRHRPNGPTYVVSPTGEVVREIRLEDPKEAGFELAAAKAAGGRLAILYEGEPPAGGTSQVRILVYDVHTGNKVATYFHQNFEIGNALACYSPDDTFTFISSDESGKMLLVRASAK
jgi:hypothetical protein